MADTRVKLTPQAMARIEAICRETGMSQSQAVSIASMQWAGQTWSSVTSRAPPWETPNGQSEPHLPSDTPSPGPEGDISGRSEPRLTSGGKGGSVSSDSESDSDPSGGIQRSTNERAGKDKPTREVALPPELDSDDFRAAWATYEAYRRELKVKPLTDRSVAARWLQMALWGHDVAIASIDRTIANGWQGLFHPEEERRGRHGRAADRRSGREYDESDKQLPLG